MNALPAGNNADFVPINGDFQNYNVVRRFLNGQVPFRDFAAYLGYGHLLLGSIMTFFVGGFSTNLMDSKVAFQFLALFSFTIISITIFWGVLRRKRITTSLLITIIIEILMLLDPTIYKAGICLTDDFHTALSASLTSGNSARFIREMAPALFIVISMLLAIVIEKYGNDGLRRYYFPIVYGVPTGLIVFYSNDYGISSAVSAGIIYLISMIFMKCKLSRKIIQIISYFVVVLLTFTLIGLIITRGSIGAYIHSLIGTGGMQAWYYNTGKSFYFYDLDRNYYSLLQGGLAFVYLILFVKNFDSHDKRIRFGVPLFMNAVAFMATNEYKLLSGGYLHEVAYSILWLTIVSEALRAILHFLGSLEISVNVSKLILPVKFITVGTALIWILNGALTAGVTSLEGHDGMTYVNNVGYLTDLGDPILSTDEFLKEDDIVFSTYASGLEAYRNSYQPSGYDYIIHVLGNEAIEHYMDCFRDGKFDYIATQRESYTIWEYWIKNANWYFYRELYQNYEPVYANKYELFWRKRTQNFDENIYGKISIEKINDSQSKIIIEAPDVSYGMADIELDYQVKKTGSKRSLLTFNTMLYVDNSNATKISQIEYPDDWYYLDDKSEGKHIGITIIDGHGEITVTSQPKANTYIDGLNARLNGIFAKDCLDYAEVIGAVDSNETVTITIENTVKNQKLIVGATTVIINGDKCNASFQQSEDGSAINITLTGASTEMKQALTGHRYYPVVRIQ